MPRLVDWDPQPLHQKPVGGFVSCHGSVVLAVWELSRSARSQLVARTFFALTEAAARRRSPVGEPGHAEVLKLLGLTKTPKNLTRVRAAARLLLEKGLVVKSGGGVKPAPNAESEILANVARGSRGIPIPRRIIRWLCRATAVETATVLGICFRCLHNYRKSFTRYGRVQCSWIARTFAVNRGSVDRVKQRLLASGWIRQVQTPAHERQRWGIKTLVNPGWSDAGSVSADEPTTAAAKSAPQAVSGAATEDHGAARCTPVARRPDLNQHLSSTKKNNQQPASGRPAGSCRWANIRSQDLTVLSRIAELYRDHTGGAGEAVGGCRRFLTFAAAAVHARRCGRKPAALLRWLVDGKHLSHITQEDEDTAHHWIKRELMGVDPATRDPSEEVETAVQPALQAVEPAPNEDVRMVRAALDVYRRVGRGSPFRLVQARGGWDKERWNRAVIAAGLPRRMLPVTPLGPAQLPDPLQEPPCGVNA